MRILIFSYDWINNYYFSGGGARRICNICKILGKEYGVKITLVTGSTPNTINKYERFSENFDIIYLGLRKPLLISAYSYSLLSTNTSLFIKDYDLIINHIAPHIPTATYLFPFVNKKTIYVIHNYFHKIYFKKYKIAGILPYTHERLLYKFGKHFIAVSDYIKDKIKLENKEAIVETIYNGIDDMFFEKPKQKPIINGDYILYFGRLDIYQKGLDILLNAYRKLDQDIKLVIAGGGKKERVFELEKLIKKLSLSERVIIKYRVSEEEKLSLIDNCLFGVMPSRYEAFGIVLLEFLSRGKPMICSNVGGLGKLAMKSKSCLLIDPNEEALETAIKRMLSIDLKNMAETAIKFSKDFKWERVAEKEYNFYKKIIGKVK